MFDISNERVPDPRYRGMNPEFVKRVWAKRRRESRDKVIELLKTAPVPTKTRTEQIVEKFRTVEIQNHPTRQSGMDIIRGFCAENDIDIDVILGVSRSVEIVHLRQLAMVEVYTLRHDLSLPQIGRLFNRDHTTIIHALKKHGAHVSQTGGKRQYSHPGNRVSQEA